MAGPAIIQNDPVEFQTSALSTWPDRTGLAELPIVTGSNMPLLLTGTTVLSSGLAPCADPLGRIASRTVGTDESEIRSMLDTVTTPLTGVDTLNDADLSDGPEVQPTTTAEPRTTDNVEYFIIARSLGRKAKASSFPRRPWSKNCDGCMRSYFVPGSAETLSAYGSTLSICSGLVAL